MTQLRSTMERRRSATLRVGLAPLLAVALTIVVSMPVQAQVQSLFKRQGTRFTAPGRMFTLTIPPNWGASLVEGDPTTVQFRSARLPGHGALYIRRVAVPSGAKPRQLMLNSLEQRLSKLPRFQVLQQRDVTVAGHPAATVVGRYDFHANAQFPRTVEEIFVIVGTDAYVFHFECAEPTAGAYASDLTMFYTSFQPRAAARGSAPFAVEDEQTVDDSELPF